MKKNIQRDEFIKKRVARQKKIRKRRLTALLILFIILLICVGAILSFTVFFPIKNISADGSRIYSSEEIIRISGIEIGDNLFAVSESDTEKRLKGSLPYVESITFDREFPGTLKIKVKDADEYACYKVGKKYYTVSRNGWVLKESYEADEKLFVVNAKGLKCKVGAEAQFEDAEQKALCDRIIDALSAENIKINEIDISNKIALKIKVEGRFEVNLGTSNNIEEKILHLGSMIEEIPKKKGGKINLSMWTSTNTNGTFVPENKQ